MAEYQLVTKEPAMSKRRIFLAFALAVAAGAQAAEFSSDRISVSVEGEGADVILIPGLGCSTRVWREMVRALPGYRYHLVQLAGFAGFPSGHHGDGPVAAPAADEIARYIGVLGLDKPAVLGHSMGGTIGMLIAVRHPASLSRLMVIDMPPFLGALFGPPGTTPDSIRPMADSLLTMMRASDPGARRLRTSANLERMIDNVPMRAGALEDALNSDPDVVARAYHELMTTDLRPELAAIRVPATVLYVDSRASGMTDRKVDAGYKEAYAGLPDVTLKRIAHSAHFMMWDQPQQFQFAVRAFLEAPGR
jgi:pimeloyl-ACP methyl ester carboxylesterase